MKKKEGGGGIGRREREEGEMTGIRGEWRRRNWREIRKEREIMQKYGREKERRGRVEERWEKR